MNLFQKIFSILDFVFILFDFLTAEKPAAPPLAPAAVILPVEKPFVDERIRQSKDHYWFECVRRIKGVRDSRHPGKSQILDDWAREVCAARINVHKTSGIKMTDLYANALFISTGRLEQVGCVFEFTDQDENNFIAKPRPEDVAKLKDLDKRLKRFLN